MVSSKETPVQRADNDFDVSISNPTFTKDHPTILFDEGHNNFHTTTGLYQPFAKLMTNDGYKLTILKETVIKELLRPANIYIIAY